MRRVTKGYSGEETPLFATMLVIDQTGQGEVSAIPAGFQHTPLMAPSTKPHTSPSQITEPPTSLTIRETLIQEVKIPQPNFPTQTPVANEVAFTGVDVVHGGAATTVSSTDARQGIGNIPKSPTLPHDSPLPRGHTPGSDEGSMTLHELTVLCTKLVKKLEQTIKTSQARRRTQIIVSNDEEDLVAEDPSKQGRSMIEEMDLDAGISLVPPHFDVQEVTIDVQVSTACPEVTAADAELNTANKIVSTASPQRNADTTANDLTLAEIIMEIKKSAAKAKGKAIMEESEQPKNIKKRVQIQMSLDEELAQKLHEEEQARFNAEQEAKFDVETENEEEQARFNAEQEAKFDVEVAQNIQEEFDAAERQRMAQVHQAAQGFTDAEWDDVLARVTADEDLVKEILETTIRRVQSFVPIGSELEVQRLKKAGQEVLEEPVKRQKIGEALGSGEEQSAEKEKELSEEELQKLLVIVPVEEVYVEALHVKYPIIEWEIYSKDTRRYWRIIRVGNHTEAYQIFADMLKKFDRDDLVKLWDLVKERFNTTDPTDDKEEELWVELKRLFEPDNHDTLWKHQRSVKKVSTTSFSICLNGDVHGYFKGGRGLRQELQVSFWMQRDQAHSSTFADDLLVMCYGNAESVKKISNEIHGSSSHYQKNWKRECKQLVDKVKSKVGDWKNKFLSYAGRVQLIGSVLGSMQVKLLFFFMDAKFIIASQTCTLTNDELSKLVADYDIPLDVRAPFPLAVMCKANSGEPNLDLLRAFLNLGPVGDWLTLSNRGGSEIDFRSFMVGGIDGEFHFELEGDFADGEGYSPSNRSVNNEAPIINVAPLNSAPPSHIAKKIGDSHDISVGEDIVGEAERLRKSSKVTVAVDVSDPIDVESDPDIHEFPFAKELKDSIDCHFVVAHAVLDNMEIKKDKAYAKPERKCKEALQDLDKNPLVLDMHAEIETLQGLKQDWATVLSKVVPDVAMKLIHSDEMGFLVAKLVKAAMFRGRCAAFEEVASLKDHFILEKMSGYHSSSKKEFDRASDGLANASYPFLAEVTADPYAHVE
ncbi:hypothetical protein Tco_0801812 [Tanacetum coccineum]|uniref:Reverse transcriptase domain-containing protein n=1 Tax=Tanacetum coccineum TaxID=301880 RepID=A0ABQ4ZX09_9ASTR